MCNNIINAWWSIVFYPASDAPQFHKGMIAMICICVATLGMTWLVYHLEHQERHSRNNLVVVEDISESKNLDNLQGNSNG
jgi:MFS transporter, ACS family, pantothenate transporter